MHATGYEMSAKSLDKKKKVMGVFFLQLVTIIKIGGCQFFLGDRFLCFFQFFGSKNVFFSIHWKIGGGQICGKRENRKIVAENFGSFFSRFFLSPKPKLFPWDPIFEVSEGSKNWYFQTTPKKRQKKRFFDPQKRPQKQSKNDPQNRQTFGTIFSVRKKHGFWTPFWF